MRSSYPFIVASVFLSFSVFLPGTCGAQAPDSGKVYSYGKKSSDGTGKYYMGREIARIMGAAGSDWLDRSSRQREENSALAVSKMPLTKESRVADIGAGTGYYSFMIAAKVPAGKVYSVEIQDELIDMLKQRINEKGVRNIEVVKGSVKDCNLPANSIDMAVMVDVYHELSYPVEVLGKIRNSLAKDGKLVLLEYKGEDPAVAIKEHHKMTVAQVQKEMKANGFELQSHGDFLPIQHLLVFVKSKNWQPGL